MCLGRRRRSPYIYVYVYRPSCTTSRPSTRPNAQARDINLDIKRVVAYRCWCNKLWNAIKFAMMNLSPDFKPPAQPLVAASCPAACRWILSRLNNAIRTIVQV